MYFGAVDPAARKVRVATQKNLIYNNGYDYITLENISFTGSIGAGLAFISSSNYCKIQNCSIEFAGQDGIVITGSYNTIDGNFINHSSEAGIYSSCSYAGTHNKIINNVIKNSGLIKGAALSGYFSAGIYFDHQTDGLIQYNTIDSSSYDGIYFNDDRNEVRNNFVNHSLINLDDGGGIYTSGNVPAGRVIIGNIVLNSIGNPSGTAYSPEKRSGGIYLDNYSKNITATNNTIGNCTWGLFINIGSNNDIENNTVFNNEKGMMFSNASGNTILNNIFFAKGIKQLTLYYFNTLNNISLFGTSDRNYYARPADDNLTIQTYLTEGSAFRTLAGWQTFSGKDASSHKSPVSIADTSNIDFYYNPAKTNKVITLGKPMIDVTGTKYANSITLLPFTSVILIVDPQPSQPGIPVYAGSSVENATPSLLTMTYSLTLANIVPAASAFAVRVNSVARGVNSVVVSGTKVQLTLAGPVAYGDVVTVSYTKPAVSPLQTASGGMAANIVNQAVINNRVNIAPEVVITSPLNNSSFTAPANITITAGASDSDGSVTLVEFYNGNTRIGSTSVSPFSFNWNNVAAGIYSLTAIATDNRNSKTKSGAISVTVNSATTTENQPPVVMISNPVKGTQFENTESIDIEVVASDPDGSVSKVILYNGSIELVELTSIPYLYSLKDADTGSYSIKAVAYDNQNASAASSVIEFTVVPATVYDANSEILNLYPNPNDGHFSIEFKDPVQSDRSNIVITDLAGKQIYNGLLSKEETIKQIDLSYIKAGIYLLIIFYREILVTKKFIKY